MRDSGIYAITNRQNGKQYIGSSIDLPKRRREHWNALLGGYHQNQHLQRSVNRYGLGAFAFDVLERCESEQLVDREQFYLDSLKPAYNMRPIANSMLGIKRSRETRERMSVALKKYYETHDAPCGPDHPMYGRKHSAETRAKMSRNGKGKGAGRPGRSPSAETRAKMSAAKRDKPIWNRGRPHSEQHKANLRKAWVGRKERKPPKGPRRIVALADLHTFGWDKQRRNVLIAQRHRRLREWVARMNSAMETVR